MHVVEVFYENLVWWDSHSDWVSRKYLNVNILSQPAIDSTVCPDTGHLKRLAVQVYIIRLPKEETDQSILRLNSDSPWVDIFCR